MIDLDILRQSLPFVRFDGYWALADLTGIPDFLSQIAPLARSLSSKAGPGAKLPRLKRWVRVTFIAYILITLPVLAFLLWIMVTRMPALLSVIVGSLLSQIAVVPRVLGEGSVVSSVFAVVQVFVLGLEALGITYLFVSLGRTLVAVARGQATQRGRVIAAMIVVVVGIAVAYAWIPNLPIGQGAAPAGAQTFEVTERSHVRTPVEYAQTPAVGGAHSPVVQNCGFYTRAVAEENAVHSLEHGAVWIAYQTDLPDEDLDTLRELARRESYLLASPVDDLPAPIVASAWEQQLRLNVATDGRLIEFVEAFAAQGQAPEAGGPCTGGAGNPEP
ncbi:MAG: DUF3105 domain-containing protein [Gemmatimonadaceae bacterium]|nr:DUF3105 domain-containing protein [Gemmatimonadaceae bacterium]